MSKMELRFIIRDGKRILQQRDCDSWESPKPWKDVLKKEIIEQIELLSNLVTVIEDLTFKVNILRIALIISILSILILLAGG